MNFFVYYFAFQENIIFYLRTALFELHGSRHEILESQSAAFAKLFLVGAVYSDLANLIT